MRVDQDHPQDVRELPRLPALLVELGLHGLVVAREDGRQRFGRGRRQEAPAHGFRARARARQVRLHDVWGVALGIEAHGDQAQLAPELRLLREAALDLLQHRGGLPAYTAGPPAGARKPRDYRGTPTQIRAAFVADLLVASPAGTPGRPWLSSTAPSAAGPSDGRE